MSLWFDPAGLSHKSSPGFGEILLEIIFWAQVPGLSIFLCILYLSEQNSDSFRV